MIFYDDNHHHDRLGLQLEPSPANIALELADEIDNRQSCSCWFDNLGVQIVPAKGTGYQIEATCLEVSYLPVISSNRVQCMISEFVPVVLYYGSTLFAFCR